MPEIGTNPSDKLVTGYSDFKDLVTEQCKNNGHKIIIVHDDSLTKEHDNIVKLGINAEMSASVAFEGLREYAKEYGLTMNDDIVIINTGNGIVPKRNKIKDFVKDLPLQITLPVLLGSAAVPSYFGVKYMVDSHKERLFKEETDMYIRSYQSHFDRMTVQKMDQTLRWRDIVAFAEFKALEMPLEKQDSVRNKIKEILELSDHGGMDYRVLMETPEYRKVYDEFTHWRHKFDRDN